MVNWWQATSRSSLGISVVVHANMSAFCLRQTLRWFLSTLGRPVLIFMPLSVLYPKRMSSKSPSRMGLTVWTKFVSLLDGRASAPRVFFFLSLFLVMRMLSSTNSTWGSDFSSWSVTFAASRDCLSVLEAVEVEWCPLMAASKHLLTASMKVRWASQRELVIPWCSCIGMGNL